LQTQANEYKGKYEAAVVGNALTSALLEAKVAAPYMDAARALLTGQGAGVDKDGKPILGDKPLVEAVKEWAASDAGKHFVAAPNSSGGGAIGGGAGNPSAGNMGGTRQERVAAIASKYKLSA
jgi:hypothetical protein